MKSEHVNFIKSHNVYGQIYLLFSERKLCCFTNVLFSLTGSIPGLGLRAVGWCVIASPRPCQEEGRKRVHGSSPEDGFQMNS